MENHALKIDRKEEILEKQSKIVSLLRYKEKGPLYRMNYFPMANPSHTKKKSTQDSLVNHTVRDLHVIKARQYSSYGLSNIYPTNIIYRSTLPFCTQ